MAFLATLVRHALVYAVVVSALISSVQSQASNSSSSLKPAATYNGGFASASQARLRVANGGAGQSGLIGAFANAFIQWQVNNKSAQPFTVEWYLGDTTQSLGYIAAGLVDVAFTYNEAAELASVKSGKSVERELVFMDHFYLAGPTANPAGLGTNDSVTDMFNKIVESGNADVATPPTDRSPTRFLSRYDKSATNIKESEMFIKIGQVPWALTYSNWYHQYPRFPIQALAGAALLDEYTLTDRGTWLSSNDSVTSRLTIFAQGAPASNSSSSPASSAASSATPTSTPTRRELALTGMLVARAPWDGAVGSEDLLNPCNALLAANPMDKDLSATFMDWLVAPDGGQEVVRKFEKNGEVLYTPAV